MALAAPASAGQPVVFGAGKKPAKKPAGKKAEQDKKAEEAPLLPGQLKKKVAMAPKGLKWGLGNEQVAKLYDKVLDDQYAPLYKKAQPGAQMEALDAELEQKKGVIRRSLVEFGDKPTGVDNTDLKGEYTYKNKESLSRITLRSGTQRFFFFFSDRLWKVYDEHKLRKGGSLGETFEEAVQILTKRLGVAPFMLEPDWENSRPFQEAIWFDGTNYIRALNRGHAKIVAVVYVDQSVQDNIGRYRTAPKDDGNKVDADVADATRKAPPPPPPADKPADKKKKK